KETSQLPVLKRFFWKDEEGWEILNAVYDKGAGLLEVASLNQVKYTVTQQAIEQPAPAPAPEAAPEPAPAPAVEQPREEPKPEPVQPIKERKRVRKDYQVSIKLTLNRGATK